VEAGPSVRPFPVPWMHMRALRALFLLNGAALGVFYPFISVILADRGVSP